MIRIKRKNSDRPKLIYLINPHKGKDKLLVQMRELVKAYKIAPDDYSTGNLKFKFSAGIYGDDEIRKRLSILQRNKCCYCEKYLDTADVEHFRPKSSFRIDRNFSKSYPGYFWLAYSWKNLLLACRGCNSKKSDLFPIRYEKNRSNHPYNVIKESPLIINPVVNRPRRSIYFNGAIAIEKNKNLMGRKTIEVLQLNRSGLEEGRRDHLKMVEALHMVATVSTVTNKIRQKDIDRARKELDEYKNRDRQFSAMTQDFLWFKTPSVI